MTEPVYLSETNLNNGNGGKRLVRPGDKVNLLPANLREKEDEDDDYFIPKNIAFLLDWLGKGPYEITGVGQWPCGKVVLYLKTSKGDGFEVDANKFK
jgi:hypothetical protein